MEQPQEKVGQKRTAGKAGLNGLVTAKWKVELPQMGAGDEQFGGCRSVEHCYKKDIQIGEGTYGQVYLAQDLADGSQVALKKIRMDNEKEGFPITAVREIKLLKTLDDTNVIRLKEIVRSQAHKVNNMKGSIYMVFDYMDHDLTGLMERQNHKFSLAQIKCYMKQLLQGLHYCHQNGVLHRDLKASNLLINNRGELKLADFGLARPYRDKQEGRFTNRVVTLWYRPPELLLGSERYGPEIDMWSVGCILAELLLGKPIFPGKDETDQLDLILKMLGSPNEQNMPGCSKLPHVNLICHTYKKNKLREHFKRPGIVTVADEYSLNLLERLLCLDPKKRISAIDAIASDFFWQDPMPCKPEELPRHQASHELDMKKLRQAEKERAAGVGHSVNHGGDYGPDCKRPRPSGGGGGPRGPPGPPPSRTGGPQGARQQYPGADHRGPPVGAYSGAAPQGPAARQPPGMPGVYPSAPPARGPPPPGGGAAPMHGSGRDGYGRSGPPQGRPAGGYDGAGYPYQPGGGYGGGGRFPPAAGPPSGRYSQGAPPPAGYSGAYSGAGGYRPPPPSGYSGYGGGGQGGPGRGPGGAPPGPGRGGPGGYRNPPPPSQGQPGYRPGEGTQPSWVNQRR